MSIQFADDTTTLGCGDDIESIVKSELQKNDELKKSLLKKKLQKSNLCMYMPLGK